MFTDPIVAELIKLAVFCTAGALTGYLLRLWSDRRELKTYSFEHLKVSEGITCNNVTITSPIGNHTIFILVDPVNEQVKITSDEVEASNAPHNDMCPFVLKCYRTKDTCVVMIGNALNPDNPYNFLTGEFKHALTNENSYVHVLE